MCAEADDAEGAIRAAQREQPDVCLVGLGVPGGGILATRGVCGVVPRAAVVILATAPDVDDLLSCVQAGAVGCLSNNIGAAALRRVVEAVTAGEAAVSRSMVLALVREVQGATLGGNNLTARERQVLGMLRRGRSTVTIADRLGISPVTVRRHISAVMQKVGAHDRAELARGGREQPEALKRRPQ